jgi:hypothetical protein
MPEGKAAQLSRVASNVIAERQRQVTAEGYPAEREAEAGSSELDVWLWFRGIWEQINGPGRFGTQRAWVSEFKRARQTNNLANQE